MQVFSKETSFPPLQSGSFEEKQNWIDFEKCMCSNFCF